MRVLHAKAFQEHLERKQIKLKALNELFLQQDKRLWMNWTGNNIVNNTGRRQSQHSLWTLNKSCPHEEDDD